MARAKRSKNMKELGAKQVKNSEGKQEVHNDTILLFLASPTKYMLTKDLKPAFKKEGNKWNKIPRRKFDKDASKSAFMTELIDTQIAEGSIKKAEYTKNKKSGKIVIVGGSIHHPAIGQIDKSIQAVTKAIANGTKVDTIRTGGRNKGVLGHNKMTALGASKTSSKPTTRIQKNKVPADYKIAELAQAIVERIESGVEFGKTDKSKNTAKAKIAKLVNEISTALMTA